MMTFCFQLLSSTQTDAANMKISDGRILSLKLDRKAVKH